MNILQVIVASFLLGWSSLGTAQLACQRAVGGYRDCTCGVQYRDVEERCCSSQTCLQPFVFTENMTCPFQCMNNGTYISDVNLCQCTEGGYGLCCEKGNALTRGACACSGSVDPDLNIAWSLQQCAHTLYIYLHVTHAAKGGVFAACIGHTHTTSDQVRLVCEHATANRCWWLGRYAMKFYFKFF